MKWPHQAAYRAKNREKLAAKQRAYHEQNRAKRHAFFRRRYKKDADALNERYLRQIHPWLREDNYPASIIDICRYITFVRRTLRNANRPTARRTR